MYLYIFICRMSLYISLGTFLYVSARSWTSPSTSKTFVSRPSPSTYKNPFPPNLFSHPYSFFSRFRPFPLQSFAPSLTSISLVHFFFHSHFFTPGTGSSHIFSRLWPQLCPGMSITSKNGIQNSDPMWLPASLMDFFETSFPSILRNIYGIWKKNPQNLQCAILEL